MTCVPLTPSEFARQLITLQLTEPGSVADVIIAADPALLVETALILTDALATALGPLDVWRQRMLDLEVRESDFL